MGSAGAVQHGGSLSLGQEDERPDGAARLERAVRLGGGGEREARGRVDAQDTAAPRVERRARPCRAASARSLTKCVIAGRESVIDFDESVASGIDSIEPLAWP